MASLEQDTSYFADWGGRAGYGPSARANLGCLGWEEGPADLFACPSKARCVCVCVSLPTLKLLETNLQGFEKGQIRSKEITFSDPVAPPPTHTHEHTHRRTVHLLIPRHTGFQAAVKDTTLTPDLFI